MYYLKLSLRLATLIFPLFIVILFVAWGIALTGGDISKFPYAFHPSFEVLKNSTDHSYDIICTNILLFGNVIVCFYLTKIFTANMQYDNSFVEYLGAPLAILFLVSWFNPQLYEITSIPGEIIGFYIIICIGLNLIFLLMGQKVFGIPGLTKSAGLIGAYNKQVDKNIEKHKNRGIISAVQQGQSVLLDYSDGSQKFIFGYLQGYTSTSVTVKPAIDSREIITYDINGNIINTRWKC